MNFIEPSHLQGVINGFSSVSASSRHILHAFPDSMAPPSIVPLKTKQMSVSDFDYPCFMGSASPRLLLGPLRPPATPGWLPVGFFMVMASRRKLCQLSTPSMKVELFKAEIFKVGLLDAQSAPSPFLPLEARSSWEISFIEVPALMLLLSVMPVYDTALGSRTSLATLNGILPNLITSPSLTSIRFYMKLKTYLSSPYLGHKAGGKPEIIVDYIIL